MTKLAVILVRAIAIWHSTFSNVHVLALIYGNLGITGERCCFRTVSNSPGGQLSKNNRNA